MNTTSPATIIRCRSCGANNRIAADKLQAGLAPVCGKCKKPLPAGTSPVEVNDATFASEVVRSPIPVLVDAWAPWCGPCRMIAPVIDELAAEMAGRVKFAKLNVDQSPQTASRLNISSIPALIVYSGGREVDRMVGLMPKPELARRLEQILA